MAEVTSNTININEHANDKIERSCKDNVSSHLASQVISKGVSTKVDNVHSTPNRTNNPQGFNDTSYTNENTNSPDKNIYLFNQKDLSKSPFKSPVFKKWNKSPQFVDTARTNTRSQRKRTISTSSDYDAFKSDLCNIENFHNFEVTELLHDLNSVVKFEDCKDIFLSSMVDTTQGEDDLLGMNKDPATDPLSISDCEKKDTDTLTDSDSKFNIRRSIRIIESKSQIKKQTSKRHFKKRKLNTAEERLLKELENFEELKEMPLIDIKVSFDCYILNMIYNLFILCVSIN